MFWYTLIYLTLFVIAVTGNKEPSLERAKYEESLANMNSAKKGKIICGILTILAALPVIVDALAKKNPVEGYTFLTESQLFKVDYSDDGPMICLWVSWIVALVWLFWILFNLNYKEANAEKLEDMIKKAEERQAAIAERIAADKRENEQFMSTITAQLGAPGKIVKLNNDLYKNAFIVFPVSQNIYVYSKTIPFSQLLGCEIKDDSYTTVTGTKEEVTRASNGSTVGRALVGGLVAGPVGAIVGGATAKKTTEVIDNTQTITHHHYFAVINLSDIATPTLRIDCGKSSPRIAEEIKGIITSIVAKKPAAQIENKSIADELTKLANLKAQGILTDEEFAQQKRLLLGSDPKPVEIPAGDPAMIELGEPEVFEDPFRAELIQLLKGGSYLEAIKKYKDTTRCDLATAKDYVDDLKAEIGI